MFKLARKNYLREIFSGGSRCTGDCGQGRRCTCSGESKEISQAPETAEKPTDGEAQNPASCINRSDIIRMALEAGANRSYNPDKWDILEIRDTDLERFAALVAAHEREECAKVCELVAINACDKTAQELSFVIRARGEA
jgi:hypothetical protein